MPGGQRATHEAQHATPLCRDRLVFGGGRRSRDGRVQLYVHERVPGIFDAGLRAWALRATGRGAEVAPRLVRYSLPAAAFLEWTRSSLRSLRET